MGIWAGSTLGQGLDLQLPALRPEGVHTCTVVYRELYGYMGGKYPRAGAGPARGVKVGRLVHFTTPTTHL